MRIEMKALFLIALVLLHPSSMSVNAEEFEFQAEVGRLMDIIINSLYTEKEIFLREMISNASDALDKIRFLSISNPDLLGDNKDLEIRIECDKEAKTLTITDTGVGMTKNDLIQNLGTIAKSGTTNFMEAIKSGNINIIGQFGVGFYSTFLVSQKVTVYSKHTDDDQYIWESSAAHTYNIEKDPAGNTLGRGTKIVIQLKEDSSEFADEKTIETLIKKYSEFINFPIKLRVFKEVSKEVEIEEEEEEPKEKKEDEEEEDDDDIKVEDVEENKETEKKKKTKTVKEQVAELKTVNDNKAIWLRPKEDIEEEEYKKFYKALSKDYDDPLSWMHFKTEGEVEFTSLLYIPKKAPHDLFENYYGKSAALRLYVRRVLINEEFEDLMPRYLNFIRGVVDSDELPINVARDSIQQVKMLKVMSRKLVRKAIEMIKKLAEDEDEESDDEDEDKEEDTNNDDDEKDDDKKDDDDDDEDEEDDEQEKLRIKEKRERFSNFWKEFGKNIKLGIIEDSANRQKLAKISRWYSSRNTTELTNLDDYIGRMKTGQDSIYFVAGESKDVLMNHPALQKLLKKGYEILLLDDPIDEFTFQHLTEYEKKKLSNIAKGDFKFPDDDDTERKRFKKLKKIFQPLTDWWKKIIPDELEKVEISQRLVDDPVVIVSTEYGQSASMERISKAQAYSNHAAAQAPSKKILEINPNHPAIKELLDRVKDDPDKETEEYAKVLYEGSLVNSGYLVANPNDFSRRFYNLFNRAIGLGSDVKISEYEVDLDDDEDEAKPDTKAQAHDDDDEEETDFDAPKADL